VQRDDVERQGVIAFLQAVEQDLRAGATRAGWSPAKRRRTLRAGAPSRRRSSPHGANPSADGGRETRRGD
jgi:hypothetical protein